MNLLGKYNAGTIVIAFMGLTSCSAVRRDRIRRRQRPVMQACPVATDDTFADKIAPRRRFVCQGRRERQDRISGGQPLTPAHYQRPCGPRGAESPYDRYECPNLPRPRTEAAQERQGQAYARDRADLSPGRIPASTG
jgi:hypothetical protein